MKILILSCHTGEGHNSAAYAMQEEFDARGIAYEMLDPIAFSSEGMKDFVSDFYNKMIQHVPGAFGLLYSASEIYSSTKLASPVYAASTTYAKKLQAYIRENHFDGVLCTHLFGMEAMTVIRRRIDPSIPCYGIFTDYTCYPFSYETMLDGLFVPKCGIRPDLVSFGIPSEVIFETGIPVSKKFQNPLSQAEAREKLGIPQNKPVYLVMGGGMGGSYTESVCSFLMDGEHDCAIYILIGRNEKLGETLAKKYGLDPRIHIVPFTREVNFYMNAANVMITKPGGLSSTEAAVANTPLIHTAAIPGCETYNGTFFSSTGMSVSTHSLSEAARQARILAEDPIATERMKAAQRSWVNPTAAADITDIIVRGVTERKE